MPSLSRDISPLRVGCAFPHAGCHGSFPCFCPLCYFRACCTETLHQPVELVGGDGADSREIVVKAALGYAGRFSCVLQRQLGLAWNPGVHAKALQFSSQIVKGLNLIRLRAKAYRKSHLNSFPSRRCGTSMSVQVRPKTGYSHPRQCQPSTSREVPRRVHTFVVSGFLRLRRTARRSIIGRKTAWLNNVRDV